jgi:hypothetical protein
MSASFFAEAVPPARLPQTSCSSPKSRPTANGVNGMPSDSAAVASSGSPEASYFTQELYDSMDSKSTDSSPRAPPGISSRQQQQPAQAPAARGWPGGRCVLEEDVEFFRKLNEENDRLHEHWAAEWWEKRNAEGLNSGPPTNVRVSFVPSLIECTALF